MLNSVIIQGRLVEAPELKTVGNGTAVCSFRIACERDFKNQSGERETDFFPVTAWRKTAETICEYCRKGQMIIVSGRLQTREYKDKAGNNRTATEIAASSFNFCGRQEDAPAQQAAAQFDELEDDNSELPF